MKHTVDFEKAIRDDSEASSAIKRLGSTETRVLRYLCGDYWQDWAAWAGPHVSTDSPNRAERIAQLVRSFVPRPLISEVVGRHINGVLGQEPSFQFVTARDSARDSETLEALERILDLYQPQMAESTTESSLADNLLSRLGMTGPVDIPPGLPAELVPAVEAGLALRQTIEAEEALIAELDSYFGAWWDKRKGHQLLREALKIQLATGRVYLRFYIPQGLLDEAGNVVASDWKEALEKIYLEIAPADRTAVTYDCDTRQDLSVFQFSTKDQSGQTVQLVEVTYLDPNGKTVIRLLGGDEIQGEAEHDCALQLFVDEAEDDPLINEAVYRNQDALNVINTMLLLNGNLAGFRERNYLNLQRPVKKVPDSTQSSGYRLEPDSVAVGPMAANFLNGIEITGPDGEKKIANGSLVITDPVSPEPLIDAISQFEDNIYAAVSQRHVKMAGDATVSAVARVQARYEYAEKLKGSALAMEGLLSSRMVGVVALAMSVAGDPRLEQMKTLRPMVVCRTNAGPITPDERRVILDEYRAGLRSKETSQILLGIEDVDGECQKLAKEQDGSLPELKERADIMQSIAGAGAMTSTAAEVAGFNAEDVARFKADESAANGDGFPASGGAAQ